MLTALLMELLFAAYCTNQWWDLPSSGTASDVVGSLSLIVTW